MSTSPKPSAGSRRASPITPAARQRLQKVFEHGQRCVEKGDHDYANKLFTQCVSEDPTNLIYLQNFLGNLKQKFGDPKKTSRLVGLRLKGSRSTISKAASSGKWEAAFAAGCAALAVSPWDSGTLVAMADACREMGAQDCRLFYLRWALEADSTNSVVNRQAAATLQDLGQFDQAIACWQRVRQAEPNSEDAAQAISRLSVEKTIQQGGYDSASISAQGGEGSGRCPSVAELSSSAEEHGETLEGRLKKAVEDSPADVMGYTELADFYLHEDRLAEADAVLTRANEATGGGDLAIRERQEEILLRKTHSQVAIAEKRAAEEDTPEAKELHHKMVAHANQVELEVYAARSERDPQNPRLKLEMGLRLKRAGKYKEAISALQAAKPLENRRAQVLLDLGECFHRIEQYKLALTHYEDSVRSAQDPGNDTHKLALYRAGVLATGLHELDRAEKHLTELAGMDYGYRDVADRLDKIAQLRKNG